MDDRGGGRRGARAAGVLPLAGALVAASALTGAAFLTVNQAGCTPTGHYVRDGNRLELVGGCIDLGDLPAGAVHQATAGVPAHPVELDQARP